MLVPEATPGVVRLQADPDARRTTNPVGSDPASTSAAGNENVAPRLSNVTPFAARVQYRFTLCAASRPDAPIAG